MTDAGVVILNSRETVEVTAIGSTGAGQSPGGHHLVPVEFADLLVLPGY